MSALAVGGRIGHGAPERVAVVLGVALVGVALTTVVLLLATARTPAPSYEIWRELAPLDLLMCLVYGPVGALIVVRSRHAVGWAFLVIGWGYAVTAAGIAWTLTATAEPTLPGEAWANPVILAGWTSSTLLVLLALPWLLTPEPPRGWTRVGVVGGAVVATAATVLRLLQQVPGGPPHPLTGGGAVSEAALRVDDALIPIYFFLGLLVSAHLVVRLHRGHDHERRGLAWLLAALLLVAFGYLTFEVGLSLEGAWLVVGTILLVLAVVLLPAAVVVLIRAEPSWRVDIAVSRTLVGVLLTITVVTAYVAAVWGLSMVTPWGRASAGVLVVAVLALAVLPLRDWLQRRVERLVFGSGADPSVLLGRVAQALASADTGTPLLAGLVASLRRALRLSHVEVALGGDADADAAGCDPDAKGRVVTIDLLSQGTRVGVLTAIAPRGQRLDPRSIRLLRQISGLVAVAAQLDEANRALENARSRLIEVRQEERRLLRRELHDGVGPALSGAALALAAVPRTSALSPDDTALLRRLGEELAERAEDVRQMARVVLPPALDEGRLGEALRVLADRHSTPRFSVEVVADGADLLDGSRQIVIYQVAAEAVRNAGRHAGARRCRIRFEVDDGASRLEVCDDGAGIRADAGTGIGIASMRERAAELGGTISIDGEGCGTRVVMVLP